MKRAVIVAALAAALGTTGCLQKETTSTITLHQDGSAHWFVLEHGVHSDDADEAGQAAEELGYVQSVLTGTHGVAEGFRRLGGEDVQVRLVHDTAPYATTIEAHFDSLSAVFERAIAPCGVPYGIDTTRANGETTWRLWVDVGADGSRMGESAACGDGLDGLVDAFSVSIDLEAGSFTRATGFTLDGQRRAVLDERANQDSVKAEGTFELSLSWRQ
jgi:hypothetical protein